MACLRPAKCFGDSARKYTMINFHLPPIAARAAVNGQPPTGFSRRVGWAPLPESAFLLKTMAQIIVPKKEGFVQSLRGLRNDSRSPQLPNQAGTTRRIHQVL